MKDIDQYEIYSVAVPPEHCPRCGTEIQSREFGAGPYHWCPDCEMVLTRNPMAAVHVIVTDEDDVLLLDEPIPQHEGVWSLPGGHAGYHEGPRDAALRELEEETGLTANPDDLELLTVYHAETPTMAFHFTTYTLDRADTRGELRPETDDFDLQFEPVDEVLTDTQRLRDSDRDRIAQAFDR